MEGMLILYLAIIVLLIASIWKIFTKAGQPGWAAIVPIYNFVVMLQVAKKPVWWILLFLIPVVNIVIMIIMYHAISQILAFGDYKYIG
jgi:chromate transport protein ChrA